MKIADAQVQMESGHTASIRRETRESLHAWTGARRPDFAAGTPQATVVVLTDAARAAQASATAETAAAEEAADAVESSPQLQLIKAMVEALTGRRIRVLHADELRPDVEPVALQDPRAANTPARAGWGVEYDRHESHDEAESTRFSAEGLIRTRDGHEIRFSVSLAMSRTYHEESHTSVRAGDARRKDPLVLNFDGGAAELSASRFSFDLDGDGAAEAVPLLHGGSGYLALDLDGDGRIGSGRELFGPQSGDGFAELARHDTDGNRWIDENDPVFGRLRVWSPSASGDGTLASLRQRNVGAVYLGSLATPFELRSTGNESLGAVRSSGVYLSENGEAGTVQQIDLSV